MSTEHMQLNYAYIGNSLEIQAPDYILPRDHFKISCRGINPVRIRVRNCSVKSEEKGEHYVIAYVTHVHGEACEVRCFSGELTETKTISVKGKLV